MSIDDMKQRFILGLLEPGIFTSKNENGDNIIVSVGSNGFQTSTEQDNGWTRINRYTYEGNQWTYEEIYER